jgi:hypothetical protein
MTLPLCNPRIPTYQRRVRTGLLGERALGKPDLKNEPTKQEVHHPPGVTAGTASQHNGTGHSNAFSWPCAFLCITRWEETCSRLRCVHIKVDTHLLTPLSRLLLDKILDVEVSRRAGLPIARPRCFSG